MSRKRKVETSSYNFLVTEVRNPNSGLIEQASYWLGLSKEKISKLRYNIQTGRVKKECPFCKSRLIVKYSRNNKNPFFSHTKIADDRKCHLIDENMPLEKKRIQQYNYGKESQEHIELKEFIEKYLSIDPLTKNLLVEKIMKGEATPYEWKKPDVSCTYDSTSIVFEVQISNTWLSDIVERDKFYMANKIQILWIFNEFDPKSPDFKTTHSDIFYNNPEINLFVLDEEAKEYSNEKGKLYFNCWFKEPSINYQSLTLEHTWKNSMVSLSELSFDSNECKPYFKKIMDLRDSMKKEIEKIKKERKERIEAERLAWKKNQKDKKESLIRKLISIDKIYKAKDLSIYEINELEEVLKDESQKQFLEEKRAIEIERELKIKKEIPKIYDRFQKYITSDIVKGNIIADNGKKISVKELTEYSIQFLENSYKKPKISYKNFEKFGFAISHFFGESGSKLFSRISNFCQGQDYWTSIKIYKKCMGNSNHNSDIRDFWKFCLNVETHNNDTLDVLILGLKKMEDLEEE